MTNKEEDENGEDRLLPPYKKLDKDKKQKLAYLLAKRTAMEIIKNSRFKKIFDIPEMKSSFQWFDLEDNLSFWDRIFTSNFSMNHNYEDAKLYTLTDFFVFYTNYCPETFSMVISKQIKDSYLTKDQIDSLNKIFIRLGYQYENDFFYPSSFAPSKRKEILNLLDLKLKRISPELHKTWQSMTEDLVSENKDKATTISAKSRKLINGLLRNLTPDLKLRKDEEDKIKRRLQEIIKNKKENEILARLSGLITALNQSQAKGDHEFIDEQTAIFTFQVTEFVIFWILSHVER